MCWCKLGETQFLQSAHRSASNVCSTIGSHIVLLPRRHVCSRTDRFMQSHTDVIFQLSPRTTGRPKGYFQKEFGEATCLPGVRKSSHLNTWPYAPPPIFSTHTRCSPKSGFGAGVALAAPALFGALSIATLDGSGPDSRNSLEPGGCSAMG